MRRATAILGLMHLVGNALILWLGYYWLGVGESTMARLAWSAVVALLVMCSALWLHGSALVYFRSGQAELSGSLRTALRNLAPLFLLAVAVLVVYALLGLWRGYSSHPAFNIASYITLKLRKPLKPASVQRVFDGILWLVRWLVVPALALPLASNLAYKGWRGIRGVSWRLSGSWLYWIEVLALLVCGVWLPLKLVTWVPRFSAFGTQMVSFLVRLLIGYLLFTGCWLLLEFSSSGSVAQLPWSRKQVRSS